MLGFSFDLLDQLTFYGSYHRNRWNQLIHFVFVPVILWSVAVWACYTGPLFHVDLPAEAARVLSPSHARCAPAFPPCCQGAPPHAQPALKLNACGLLAETSRGAIIVCMLVRDASCAAIRCPVPFDFSSQHVAAPEPVSPTVAQPSQVLHMTRRHPCTLPHRTNVKSSAAGVCIDLLTELDTCKRMRRYCELNAAALLLAGYSAYYTALDFAAGASWAAFVAAPMYLAANALYQVR